LSFIFETCGDYFESAKTSIEGGFEAGVVLENGVDDLLSKR